MSDKWEDGWEDAPSAGWEDPIDDSETLAKLGKRLAGGVTGAYAGLVDTVYGAGKFIGGQIFKHGALLSGVKPSDADEPLTQAIEEKFPSFVTNLENLGVPPEYASESPGYKVMMYPWEKLTEAIRTPGEALKKAGYKELGAATNLTIEGTLAFLPFKPLIGKSPAPKVPKGFSGFRGRPEEIAPKAAETSEARALAILEETAREQKGESLPKLIEEPTRLDLLEKTKEEAPLPIIPQEGLPVGPGLKDVPLKPEEKPAVPKQEGIPFEPLRTEEPQLPIPDTERLATRHDVPTMDFPLRQEVLEQPDIAQAIDAFRTRDMELTQQLEALKKEPLADKKLQKETVAELTKQIEDLKQEFAAGMELLGIKEPADTYGRALYEPEAKSLPIEKIKGWNDLNPKPLGGTGKKGKGQGGAVLPSAFISRKYPTEVKKLQDSLSLVRRMYPRFSEINSVIPVEQRQLIDMIVEVGRLGDTPLSEVQRLIANPPPLIVGGNNIFVNINSQLFRKSPNQEVAGALTHELAHGWQQQRSYMDKWAEDPASWDKPVHKRPWEDAAISAEETFYKALENKSTSPLGGVGKKQGGAIDPSIFVGKQFSKDLTDSINELSTKHPLLMEHWADKIKKDPSIKKAIEEQAFYWLHISNPNYGRQVLWDKYTENKTGVSGGNVKFGFVKETPLETLQNLLVNNSLVKETPLGTLQKKIFDNVDLPKNQKIADEILDLYESMFGESREMLPSTLKSTDVELLIDAYVEPLARISEKLMESMQASENRIGGSVLDKFKLGGVGKKQGGAIGFKEEGPKALDEGSFKEKGIRAGYSQEVVDAAWKKYELEAKGKAPIGNNDGAVKAMDNIPGLKGLAPVELKPLEEMLPRWAAEQDIPVNVFRDALSSGGRMTALRTNNSFVNWVVEKVNNNLRTSEVISKKAIHDVVSASKKLTTLFRDTELVNTMRELMSKEGKLEELNLKTPEQRALADALRKAWDELYKAVNAERAIRGYKPVEYRPNYLTAIFSGPYRGLVRDPATGNVIGVVGAKTMKEAQLAVDTISAMAKEQGLDIQIESPTFSQSFSGRQFQKNIGAYYTQMNELMNLLGTESPAGKAFQDIATEWYDRRVRDHLGYRQHFKSKKGVIGSEGNKPWKDIRENALDMLDAQTQGLQNGWQWVAQQKTAREIHAALNAPETQHLRNAGEYLTKYYDNAFGRDAKGLDPVRGFIDAMAKQMGTDPAPIYELLGITRNGALVTTLGMSGGFIISQLVQVPQALIAASQFLKGKGISANATASFYEGLHDFYASRHKKGAESKDGAFAYDYFAKNGTFDPQLLEKRIPRKLISTSGQSWFQKVLTDSLINGPVWLVENYNKHLGHISIEMAETATRGTYAMSMFHYLRRAGFDKETAVRVADKLTSDFFVDYNFHERPMVWSSLGEIGKFASTVTTFKMNALNQLATFASHKSARAAAASMGVLVLLSGVTGLPGFGEVEDAFSAAKRYISPDIQTPKEVLMKHAPDVITYGALAAATDTNIHQKFNQADIRPDDLNSFLFPLWRLVYNVGEAGLGAIKNPNKETLGRLAWEVAPGGFKAFPEKYIFTDKQTGITLDPRKAGKGMYEESGIIQRSEADWKKRGLGLTSLRESKAKETSFMIQRDKEITDRRLQGQSNKIVQAISIGDEKQAGELIVDYLQEGGTKEALQKKIQAAMVGKNTVIKDRILMKLKGDNLRQAKETKSKLDYLGE